MDAKFGFVLRGSILSQNGSVKSIQLVFSSNLKRLRKSRKLTQEQLAEDSGYTPRYIQMLEAGEHWPSLEMIQALAKCLKVKETELFQLK